MPRLNHNSVINLAIVTFFDCSRDSRTYFSPPVIPPITSAVVRMLALLLFRSVVLFLCLDDCQWKSGRGIELSRPTAPRTDEFTKNCGTVSAVEGEAGDEFIHQVRVSGAVDVEVYLILAGWHPRLVRFLFVHGENNVCNIHNINPIVTLLLQVAPKPVAENAANDPTI